MAKYDKNNCEIPDKTPVDLPIGYGHPEPLQDMIARIVSNTLHQNNLAQAGAESFEDSDDFDTPDAQDTEFLSEHTIHDMQDEMPATLLNAQPEAAAAPPQPTQTPAPTAITPKDGQTPPLGVQ